MIDMEGVVLQTGSSGIRNLVIIEFCHLRRSGHRIVRRVFDAGVFISLGFFNH